jgi:hypothetical protein
LSLVNTSFQNSGKSIGIAHTGLGITAHGYASFAVRLKIRLGNSD